MIVVEKAHATQAAMQSTPKHKVDQIGPVSSTNVHSGAGKVSVIKYIHQPNNRSYTGY